MIDSTVLNRMLQALGEHLDRLPGLPISLVVCGGAAINAGGFLDRPTKDVDVVALLNENGEVLYAEPLPEEVIDARGRVALDFGADDAWLNAQSTALLDTGSLPLGFEARLNPKRFGNRLVVQFLGRQDLIALKLSAFAGRQIPRDLQDLRALAPTTDELASAVAWIGTHNAGDGYLVDLRWALGRLGHEDLLQ